MGQLDYIKFKVPIADTEFKLAPNILGYLAIEPGEKNIMRLAIYYREYDDFKMYDNY